MLWMVGGFFLLGVACGMVFRLPFFAAVLVVAIAIIVVSDLVHGSANIVLDTILGIVALQLGYGCGIGARAFVDARKRRRETPTPDRTRYGSMATRRERH